MNIREALDQLDLLENLGPLSDLKAGALLNVFKQRLNTNIRRNHMSAAADDSKFVNQYDGSSVIGQGSELVDFGAIKSWADIRKKVGRKNEQAVQGVVLYADGTAFSAVHWGDSNIYANENSGAVLSFDPTKLPDYNAEAEAEKSYRDRLPSGTAYEKEDNWDKITRQYTGKAVRFGDFDTYIDRVIERYPESEFRAVAITADQKAKDTRARRGKDRETNDKLRDRQAYPNSLKSDLSKFKAERNFTQFDTTDEVLEFVGDFDNLGEKFVYKEKEYEFLIKGNTRKLEISPEKLIRGDTIVFTLDLPVTDPTSYASLTVRYEYSNGRAVPVKVGY